MLAFYHNQSNKLVASHTQNIFHFSSLTFASPEYLQYLFPSETYFKEWFSLSFSFSLHDLFTGSSVLLRAWEHGLSLPHSPSQPLFLSGTLLVLPRFPFRLLPNSPLLFLHAVNLPSPICILSFCLKSSQRSLNLNHLTTVSFSYLQTKCMVGYLPLT